MPQDYAVLTGDLVGSTAQPKAQIEQAMTTLRKAAGEIGGWAPVPQETRFSMFRGDGWQIAVTPPALALRAALFLTAVLRAEARMRTRISIATGAAEVPEDGNLNRASGPVFTRSGRNLEDIPRRAGIRHADGGAVAAVACLADHIAWGWTPIQAGVMALILPPTGMTQTDVARAQDKSPQAVQQALTAAGYHAISEALAQLESGAV